jgi:DHA2 family multidrug resistance protein
MMTVLGFVLYGSLVMLPLFLQTILGYPAVEAGIAMAPRGFGSFLAMPVIGYLMSRLDPRKMVAAGLFVGGVMLYQLSSINLNAGYWDIFWPQFIQGMAMGLLFVPLSTISMVSIPREKLGHATSLFNLMRNLGGGIGIAYVATAVSRRTTVQQSILSEHVNLYSPQAQTMLERARAMFLSQGADATTAARQALGAVSGMIARQAAMIAFIDILRLLALIFICGMPLVFIMRRPKGSSAPPPGAH